MNSKLLKSIKADHKALLANPELLHHLTHERLLSQEQIESLQIGLIHHEGYHWFSFPVYDAKGKPKFKKLKKLPNAPEEQTKGMVTPTGNQATLYPAWKMNEKEDRICVCEGEMDTVAARSLGLPAFCGTAGAETFKASWFSLFQAGSKKRVYLLLDNDKSGKRGVKKIVKILRKHYPEWAIFVVQWPEGFPEKGDVTDFLKQYKGNDAANALLSLAKPFADTQAEEPEPESAPERNYTLEELEEAGNQKYLLPIQDFQDGVAYITVSLMLQRTRQNYVITSTREYFPCSEEALAARGFMVTRLPAADMPSRWNQQRLVLFLKGEQVPTLAEIHALIAKQLQRYVDFTDKRFFNAVSLWIIATYFYRLFSAFPYLHITGMYHSGKSNTLTVLSLLSFNGELLTSSSSAASIVRLVHANGSTVCIDEVEKLWNAKDENTGTLQDILRSGYKCGIPVTKCEPDGKESGKFKVVLYDPYSPKALAGIEGLEQALASRCIPIVMLRTRDKTISHSQIHAYSTEWSDLRSRMYPAVLSSFGQVNEAKKALDMTDLMGREAELWRPLLTVAKAIGNDALFSEMLMLATEVQEKRRVEDEDTVAPKLLLCIHELIEGRETIFVPCRALYDSLAAYDEEFAWIQEPKSTQRGKWLNKMLTRLGLWHGPAKLESIHGKKVRGYYFTLSKVKEMAERYGVLLSLPAESVTSVTKEESELL